MIKSHFIKLQDHIDSLKCRVRELTSDPSGFDSLALDVFRFQYKYNEVYQRYVGLLGIDPHQVLRLIDIPFLPISAFRHHRVSIHDHDGMVIFKSSGTTSDSTSKHHVYDLPFYKDISAEIFQAVYSNITDLKIMALLPGYVDRPASSLIYMIKYLMEQSNSESTSFFAHDFNSLKEEIDNHDGRRQLILFGVTHALIDFVDKYDADLSQVIIIETGGMKGRKKELTREELHAFLRQRSHCQQIHSEYGMAELMSQAYASDNSLRFNPPPSMKIMINKINEPLDYVSGKTGIINVMDLANIESCSFIKTDDIGRVGEDGLFNVYGRLDAAMLRGCNLMYTI